MLVINIFMKFYYLKSENKNISIIAYIILFIIFLIILYFTGILEIIVRFIIDKFLSAFSLNKLVSGTRLYKILVKLSGCTDELFHTIFTIYILNYSFKKFIISFTSRGPSYSILFKLFISLLF